MRRAAAAALAALAVAGCGVRTQDEPDILPTAPPLPTATPTATEAPTSTPAPTPSR